MGKEADFSYMRPTMDLQVLGLGSLLFSRLLGGQMLLGERCVYGCVKGSPSGRGREQWGVLRRDTWSDWIGLGELSMTEARSQVSSRFLAGYLV